MTSLTRKNTCIVVVTFNPSTEFTRNVSRYLEIADKVIIVDNNSAIDVAALVPTNVDVNKVVFINSEVNNGIAWGLNQGLTKAIFMGYEYVLSFDQDSYPVSNILELYASIANINRKIGLLGTSFTDEEIQVNCVHVKKTLTIITSGALHILSKIPQIGLYDESLFIDSVDFDFALRVKSKGFEVLRVKEPLICHHLGNPIKKMGIQSSNHSSFRRYYMARNHVIILKRYWKQFPLWVLKKNLFFMIQLLKMMILEGDKKAKLCLTLKGFHDAFKNK